MPQRSLFIFNFNPTASKNKFFFKLLLVTIPFVAFVVCYIFYYETQYSKKRIGFYSNRDLLVGGKAYHALSIANKNYKVLLAGDSRALFQLNPQIFNQNSLESYNIGCEACELINFWNVFQALELENKIPLFIISVGAYQLNDNSPDYLDEGNFYRMNSLDRLRILGFDYFQKSKYFLSNRWELKDYLIRIQNNPPSKEIKLALGYKRNPPVKTSQIKEENPVCNHDYINRHPWYKDGTFDKARLRVVKEIISEMSNRRAKFILFNAPLSPAFRYCVKNTPIEKAERFFSYLLKEATKNSPNIQFIDFFDETTIPKLDNNGFSDNQHLNDNGAKLLSQYFIDLIKSEPRYKSI